MSELVDGGTLDDWAVAAKRSWRQSVELLTGVADALAAAHAAGVLHRDMKPGNILIGANGYAKLADFGLAKLARHGRRRSGERRPARLATTREGLVVGTVAYMSPEQAAGQPLDARSDVFSFGIVLYERLAGRRPFEAKNDLELLKAIAHAPPRAAARRRAGAAADTPSTRRSRRSRPTAIRRCRTSSPTCAARRASRARSPPSRRLLCRAASAPRGSRAVSASASRSGPAPRSQRCISCALRRRPRRKCVLRSRSRATSSAASQSRPMGSASPTRAIRTARARRGLRPIDSLEAHPLPGTDDGGSLFWSPDGRYLAFYADGKLKKIDVGGGPAQTIVDEAQSGGGGSWSRGGTILLRHPELRLGFRNRGRSLELVAGAARTRRGVSTPAVDTARRRPFRVSEHSARRRCGKGRTGCSSARSSEDSRRC